MEEIDILYEVKSLDLSIKRRLFELHQEENLRICPSPLQMRILKFLSHSEKNPVFLKDLQEHFEISKAAISDVIDKMQKKGFLEKSAYEKDGRKVQILLLDLGREMLSSLEENARCVREEIIKDISPSELELFLSISHKMQENLKKEGKIC